MKFVVSHDKVTGLWRWELRAVEGGAVARSAKGFPTLDLLLANIEEIRAQAPKALVFDLLGRLDENA